MNSEDTLSVPVTLHLAGVIQSLNACIRLIEGYQGPQVPALLVIRENLEKFISENIELTTEEKFLLNHDKRILAIKSVRGRTGLGIRWSKAAVDRCDLEKLIRREPHPCEIFRPPTVV